jgi:hypothetical protein
MACFMDGCPDSIEWGRANHSSSISNYTARITRNACWADELVGTASYPSKSHRALPSRHMVYVREFGRGQEKISTVSDRLGK